MGSNVNKLASNFDLKDNNKGGPPKPSDKVSEHAKLIIDDEATAEQQVTALANIRKWFDVVIDESIAYSIINEIPFCL